MTPVMSLKQASYSYETGGKPVRALREASVDVMPGDLMAIQGPSGSGKSTLLHILGCLLKPDSGSVEIDGVDISTLSKDQLSTIRNQKIGFVFQQFHLIPRMSVLDNILLPAFYSDGSNRAAKKKALEIAKRVGLEPFLHHMPNQLSGGQQQKVALSRALLTDPSVILADEPTGNLDSKSTDEILKIFRELNDAGHTIVLITHDGDVAEWCDRQVEIRDGLLTEIKNTKPQKSSVESTTITSSRVKPASQHLLSLLPLSFFNLKRNKLRSLLTMLGVIIGIAAVLAMITLGQFAKETILEGYEELGVNRIVFRGYSNWNLKATDKYPLKFRAFSVEKDIAPLTQLFPEIELFSPVMRDWGKDVKFGGRSISDISSFGVMPEYFAITNRKLLLGEGFASFHVDRRSPVCAIGFDVAKGIFKQVDPIGKVIYVGKDDNAFSCRVTGVLRSQSSNIEWFKPNLQILMPHTYLEKVASGWWNKRINTIVFKIKSGHDVEDAGKKIKAFFQSKYGKSGRFNISKDDVMVAQMKKFLNIFAVLLSSIAFISLFVGGIGITNMMLVSVTERYREIGLRKAIGATDGSIRFQFLLESLVLCVIAGVIGITLGFCAYQGIIYGATKFVKDLEYQWILDPSAILISSVCIIAVGVASGLVPAFKAERLQVIEALRSE